MNLFTAIQTNNRWYKNCRNVRRRGGLICNVCPFREEIEVSEALLGKTIPKSKKEAK